MHAACDLGRPCSRCRQHKLECVDVPRKYRSNKKRVLPADFEDEEDSVQTVNIQHIVDEPTTSNSSSGESYAEPIEINENTQYSNNIESIVQAPNTTYNPLEDEGLWAETYEQLFDNLTNYNYLNDGNENNNSNALLTTQGTNDYMDGIEEVKYDASTFGKFQPAELQISEMPPLAPMIAVTAYGRPQTSAVPLVSPERPFHPPQHTLVNNDLSFLIQQMAELRESNQELQKRLALVSSELVDIKAGQPQSPQNASLAAALQNPNGSELVMSSWYKFSPVAPASEVAVSIWQAVKPYCGTNVLVECNAKFVEMLGYPLEYLQNSFTCGKLVRKQDICPANRENPGRNWPKRTQVITAFGLKEVYLTISPVMDNDPHPKFYILHFLEANN